MAGAAREPLPIVIPSSPKTEPEIYILYYTQKNAMQFQLLEVEPGIETSKIVEAAKHLCETQGWRFHYVKVAIMKLEVKP